MELLYTAHVPPGEGPFPTVVALHGWGASAHDLIGLAPVLFGGECLVLCPQGPVAFPIAEGLHGYGWFPLTEGGPVDPNEFRRGSEAVQRFLDEAAARYPMDPRKTVLLGFSQGGVMAYDVALRDPGRFAGLVALSGWLPGEHAEQIPKRPEHENLPTLVIHGTQDPMIPIERGQQSVEALRQLGVPVVYREYEMGHEIQPDALRELVSWLQDKVFQPIQLV